MPLYLNEYSFIKGVRYYCFGGLVLSRKNWDRIAKARGRRGHRPEVGDRVADRSKLFLRMPSL